MTADLSPTVLKVYENDGYVLAMPGEESRVNAAVQRLIDSGGHRDTLLDIECHDGRTYWVRASRITSWYISSPESRRVALQWEKDREEEEKAVKAELGIWEET